MKQRRPAQETSGREAAARRMLLWVIGVYRRWISPLLPPACRFHPTCSEYAAESIQIHGVLRGSGLAVRRLCRCHPLNAGGFDPVPPRKSRPGHPVPGSPLTMKEVR